MDFQINDYVFIVPTGDPAIDRFLDQQMTITAIIPTDDCGYRYTRYELTGVMGESITVVDGEMIEKGVRLNGN